MALEIASKVNVKETSVLLNQTIDQTVAAVRSGALEYDITPEGYVVFDRAYINGLAARPRATAVVRNRVEG